MYDLVSGIWDFLAKSSNVANDIRTIMRDLDQIKKMQNSDDARRSKGEEELDGIKGTIYDSYEIGLLKPLLLLKARYWNPNYQFVSWEELFSKMDKVDKTLSYLKEDKSELEDILLTSEDIKRRLDEVRPI